MQKRMASCHPDRPHLARGLCESCYERERSKIRKDRWKEGSEGKRAKCHPERRNYSRGLCRYCYNKRFLSDNPEKKRVYYENHKRNWLGYTLRHKFGITVEQYDELLKKQNGVCAICGKPEKGKRRLSVDHDHKTREVRGLLCQKCNSIIGMALDNESILDKAIEYLKERLRR